VDEEVIGRAPRAGGPVRRRRTLLVGCGLLAIAIAASIALWTRRDRPATPWTDQAAPPGVFLTSGLGYSSSADPQTRRVTYGFTLTNISKAPIGILRLGVDEPGLKLMSTLPAGGFTIAARGHTAVVLDFEVTDCGQVGTAEEPLPVHVRYQGRVGTIQLSLQDLPARWRPRCPARCADRTPRPRRRRAHPRGERQPSST